MSTEEKQDQNVDNTEEVKKGDDVQSTAESKNTEQEHMIPKSRFDEVNQKYQDEAKRRAALEKQIEENQKKRLKEQEDYKALYEQADINQGLRYIGEVDNARIFAIQPAE